MIGLLETVLVIMGLVGVLAGTSVLARSLMLYLLEPRVQYVPEPAYQEREAALALAALGSLKEMLAGLLPSRWPR